MGIIKITPRNTALQSGHSAGAGSVHIPNLPTNANSGEIEKWRSTAGLGRNVVDLGDKLMKTAAILQEIKTETQLDEFETDFLKRLHEINMNPESGFLTKRIATIADADALAKDAPKTYQDLFNEMTKSHELTGVRKTWAMNRVNRIIESANLRLADRVSSACRQLNISKAAENVEARHVIWNDGMDDPHATEELLDAVRKSLYAQGFDDNTVELKFGEKVENLAEEYATRRFSELPSEAAVDEELKKFDENPSGILAGNKTLADQFSTQRPFSQDATDRLKGRLEHRRREIQMRDRRIVDQAANVGIIAVAEIRDKNGNYPPGRLATVESSIDALEKIKSTLPGDCEAAARAATHISELNSKADMIAQQEIIDEYLLELKTNPKAKIYSPETKNEKGEISPAQNAYIGSGRKERLAPMVQQMVDQQRQGGSDAQARKANFANWKLKMLGGAKNPGEYHNEIFKAAEKGELTLDEYVKLKNEFDSSWAQGFSSGTKSPKQITAEAMLGVLKEFFPSDDLESSFIWNDKTSALELKKDAEYPGLEFMTRADPSSGFEAAMWGLSANPFSSARYRGYPVEPRKMAPSEVEKIINVATALSFYDGQQIDFDPITGGDEDFFTGKKINTGKDAPRFNATNYFKRYLGRLKDESKAKEAAEYVMQLVEAERNISGSFTDLEDKRRTAIEKGAKGAENIVTIRNRKTGEGVTTKK